METQSREIYEHRQRAIDSVDKGMKKLVVFLNAFGMFLCLLNHRI
jgi:hypothetical protein